ncbi:hypothetical protein CASFOL_016066 [Castilleja foliolosa]|uniref:Pectinesterase inhibitor domain-containing protein n=1 Tax=Castilleja foliolosa TaxID=1961234 RepID=A0ABD3DFI9_9LAMI
MPSSTIPIPIASIFLLFLISNVIVTSSSNPLIERACSSPRIGSKSKLCIKILESEPNIISAKNLYNLSLAIMQSGTPISRNTITYIENLLNGSKIEPDLKQALEDCSNAHYGIISSFRMASNEVRGKEYEGAGYDLLIGSTDGFKNCSDDVKAGKIMDSTILKGNDVALIYAFSATRVVDELDDESGDQIN